MVDDTDCCRRHQAMPIAYGLSASKLKTKTLGWGSWMEQLGFDLKRSAILQLYTFMQFQFCVTFQFQDLRR